MASMLTFQNGKSQGFQWIRKSGSLERADENFARELMQLFTIGAYELNQDGTRKLDANGRYIKSYSNDDVMEFARAWTGFYASKRRGNSVAQNGNHIDPMIVKQWYVSESWLVWSNLWQDNYAVKDLIQSFVLVKTGGGIISPRWA